MLNLSRASAPLIAIIFFLAASTISAANACIDINTAPQEELEKIKHIGESRAKQIIMLREEKLFSSVDDLDRVVGIGPARIADIKAQGLACVEVILQQELQLSKTTAPLLEIVESITYPSGIIFSEILPSPKGADETEEWIEIFNKNNFEIDLSGWQIMDKAGKTSAYAIPAGIKISAMEFLVLWRQETKIILNNDGDGLDLTNPGGEITDSVSYKKTTLGQSYGLINSNWVWSENPTPGAVNIIPAKSSAFAKATADKSAGEVGLAAVSEPITEGQNRRNFYPLAAFTLAILSGFVILLLKHVRT